MTIPKQALEAAATAVAAENKQLRAKLEEVVSLWPRATDMLIVASNALKESSNEARIQK